MTSQDTQPGAQAQGKIAIDPTVALNETVAKAQADEAYYRNRCLLLGQENHILRQTLEAQKAEIERLAGTKPTPETTKAD
jgi:hypothetical protein